MTESEVIDAAREVKAKWDAETGDAVLSLNDFALRFAAIISAKQKEKDAMICEATWKNAPNNRPDYTQNAVAHGCIACANAIRGQE